MKITLNKIHDYFILDSLFRKVTLIMMGQLFFTLCAMIPISFYDPVRDYLNTNGWIVIVSVFLMAIFTMFLIFCSWLARLILVNYSLIFSLTTFTAFWMTCLCVKYSHTLVNFFILLIPILRVLFAIVILIDDFKGSNGNYYNHISQFLIGFLCNVHDSRFHRHSGSFTSCYFNSVNIGRYFLRQASS